MSMGRFKNIIIFMLIFLAVYLTSQLWFEDSAETSILASIYKPREATPQSGLEKYFAYPTRIVTGDGSSKFFISYSMAENDIRKLCDSMIEDALQSGTVREYTGIDWTESITGAVAVYEYSFTMKSAEFLKAMGIKNSPLSSELEAFDSIIVQADEVSGALITLHDSASNKCAQINANLSSYGSEFLTALNEAAEDRGNDIYYESSILAGIDSDKNFFIPAWDEKGCYYVLGKTATDYYDSSVGVEKSVIRANLLPFFDNPSAVYDATTDVIASGDENTIVKYYSNDVLEYTSYKWDSKTTDLLDDYAAALDFIAKRDVAMVNEIYLSHYNDEQNGERHFYFDYVVNDLPVVFSDRLKSAVKEQTANGIKVVLKEGNLVGYTRLAYNFSIVEDMDLANWDIPGYISGSGADLDDFKSITLGYSANEVDLIEDNNTMSLYVEFMTTDGISSVEALKIEAN